MKAARRLAPLGLVLALALLVAAVAGTTARGSGAASKPIVIGWALDLTKAMAPFDAPGLTGAQLEIQKINAKGGVDGRKLQLKFVNTQLDPKKTKQAAADLIRKGADVLFVTCDVEYAAPAVQEGLNAGKLTIAPCIGTDQMGPRRFGAKGKLAFSTGNAAQDEGAAMAEYALKQGWKTAQVVPDNLLVYFRDVCKAFEVRFQEKGGKIVHKDGFVAGDKTIENVISRVNNEKSDVVAFCDAFGDLPTFVAGMRSLNNQTPILNSWGGDGNYWYPKNPQVTNYYYVTYASAFGDDPNPTVRALAAQMTKLGKPPGSGAFVQGPTAVEAVVAAIKAAGGSTNGAKLAAAMEHFKGVPTLSGKISFSPTLHSVFGRTYRVIKVTDNKPKVVGQIKASSPAKIH
jgi:branched-chain amino acid transport system substrate-binding protein